MEFKSKVTWIFFFLLIGASIGGFICLYDESFLAEDSTQYLSVARNFLEGKGFSTSILYYDEHYLMEGIPAAQTVWPPGYPFMIALVSMLGIPSQYAAFLLSLICFNMIAIIIYQIAKISGHRQLYCLTLSALWYCFVIVWFNILNCLGDIIFILSTLVSFRCVIQNEIYRKKIWVFIAGAFAALAFTIRYAGIFFIISLIVFYLIRFIRQKSKQSFFDIWLVSIFPFLSILVLSVRNYFLVGNPTGQSPYHVENSITWVLYKFYLAFSHTFGFSRIGLMNARTPEIILIIFTIVSLVFFLSKFHKFNINKHSFLSIFNDTSSLLSLIYMFISVIFLAYYNKITMDGLDPRYIMALLPFFLFVVLHFLNILRFNNEFGKKFLSLFYCGLFVVFLSGQVNVFDYYWKNLIKTNDFRKIYIYLQQPFHSGTLFEFLRKSVTIKTPILGNRPQLLGAVLDRPVVGLSPSWYGSRTWSGDEVKKIVMKYNVQFVLFLPELLDGPNKNKYFFEVLKRGYIPSWLELIYFSRDALVYRVK